jgi:hypothetical protein
MQHQLRRLVCVLRKYIFSRLLSMLLLPMTGRPVDVEVSEMGLFISDENAGAVYRVAYNSSFDAAATALAQQQITPYEAGPP